MENIVIKRYDLQMQKKTEGEEKSEEIELKVEKRGDAIRTAKTMQNNGYTVEVYETKTIIKKLEIK